MSVKVHEAYSLDSQQHRLLWWDDFLGDQIQDEWTVAGTGSGAVIDQQTGGIIRLTTLAVVGSSAILSWGGTRSLLISKKITMEIRVKPSSAVYEELRLYLRFDANDYLGFRAREVAGGATTWIIRCASGGLTSVDSGVALDTDYHIFRIECFPTGEVHFYIDGVETGNSPITTNITALHLMPYLYIEAEETVIKNLDIDYVVIRQEI